MVALSIVVSGLISFIGFLVTIYIVKKSTESQIFSNTELIKSQIIHLEKEMDFKSKQLIAQNIIEYSSKLISGQTNLIIKMRDFGVFYNGIDENEKLDRANHVGQIYQELRDTSNQLVQDYHVLELFFMSKGRNILNFGNKNKLFFNLLWPYLEILLMNKNSKLTIEKESQKIEELFSYSDYEKIGKELKHKLGVENLSIYLILNELNSQISDAIKSEIKKAA